LLSSISKVRALQRHDVVERRLALQTPQQKMQWASSQCATTQRTQSNGFSAPAAVSSAVRTRSLKVTAGTFVPTLACVENALFATADKARFIWEMAIADFTIFIFTF